MDYNGLSKRHFFSHSSVIRLVRVNAQKTYGFIYVVDIMYGPFDQNIKLFDSNTKNKIQNTETTKLNINVV